MGGVVGEPAALSAFQVRYRRAIAAIPHDLPRKYHTYWREPWRESAKRSPGFRRWLHKRGYLSPHFTIRGAASKDGRQIPRRLILGARNHAFNLEKLRHRLGDKPLPVLSWYRSPARNAAVGGAKNSKHLQAIATDHAKEHVAKVGRGRFLAQADSIFKSGGLGAYTSGAVHVDSRGVRARWTTF